MAKTVFDKKEQKKYQQARAEYLIWVLGELGKTHILETALDVGCGVGYFSDILAKNRLFVTALDVRETNVREAANRYPGLTFMVANIEDAEISSLGKFGKFDVALCFGLLYHLENPFAAIRNLSALADICIIESLITRVEIPILAMRYETECDDQGEHYVSFLPSRSCLVTMFSLAGFGYIYDTTRKPIHEDLDKNRIVMIASKTEIIHPEFIEITVAPRRNDPCLE